jgi:hypothetical protein
MALPAMVLQAQVEEFHRPPAAVFIAEPWGEVFVTQSFSIDSSAERVFDVVEVGERIKLLLPKDERERPINNGQSSD